MKWANQDCSHSYTIDKRDVANKAIKGGWIPKETCPVDKFGFLPDYLDPKFWQCLGNSCKEEWGIITWRHQWKRFIDHLADEKEPVDFFKNLII